MVLGIQILGVCFALFMIYYSFLHYKRNEFTNKEFTFWVFLWILFAYIALFPKALGFIVESLSLSRPLDFFIITGFMVLLSMFFYTYTLVRINQRKIERVVRRIARQKSKKK